MFLVMELSVRVNCGRGKESTGDSTSARPLVRRPLGVGDRRYSCPTPRMDEALTCGEIFVDDARDLVAEALEQALAAMRREIHGPHALPILRVGQPQLLPQPVQIPPPILPVRPKPLGRARKQPLFPVVVRVGISENGDRRVAKFSEQPCAVVSSYGSVGNLVPVRDPAEAELAAEPRQVAAPIGARLPKARRDLGKAPLQPRVVRAIIFEDRTGRVLEPGQEAACVPLSEVLGRNPVPVFHATDAELLAQPLQTAAAIAGVVPEPLRDLAEAPFQPPGLRETVLHERRGRPPEQPQESRPMPCREVVRGELIPILLPLESQLLAEPRQVAPAVGALLPKAERDMPEAPLQPLHLRPIVCEDGEGESPNRLSSPAPRWARKVFSVI